MKLHFFEDVFSNGVGSVPTILGSFSRFLLDFSKGDHIGSSDLDSSELMALIHTFRAG